MVRIGNDIVDLKVAAAESNWQRRGFLDKVFTESEQKTIHLSDNPFETVWRMWSMKESAYKAYIQETKNRFFNPKRLECELSSEKKGVVVINGSTFKTETEVNDTYVYTVASSEKEILNSYLTPQVLPFGFDYASRMTVAEENNNKLIDKSNTYVSSVFRTEKNQERDHIRARLLQSISEHCGYPKEEFCIAKTAAGVPFLFHLCKKLPCSISITHHGNFGAYSVTEI